MNEDASGDVLSMRMQIQQLKVFAGTFSSPLIVATTVYSIYAGHSRSAPVFFDWLFIPDFFY